MNQQDEQTHLDPTTPDGREADSTQALWKTYKTAQTRHQKLFRPVAVILGLALVALLGVALWIVAVL
ncbi:MAG: hypothetical protein RJB13_1297 [Pseudomonadota bacterium]|jgi:hypothetical protein